MNIIQSTANYKNHAFKEKNLQLDQNFTVIKFTAISKVWSNNFAQKKVKL